MEKENFFKNEYFQNLSSFKENTVEWKDAVLFDEKGEILWPDYRPNEYNGYFQKTEEVKNKLIRFLGILRKPEEYMENNEDYQKLYKTLHRYFYTKGVEFGTKYNLLRLNPPFMIFRDFKTEEGLIIVNVMEN